MNVSEMKITGLSAVTISTSFYITFDGRCCYCRVPEFHYSPDRLYMEVLYEDNIREQYLLTSRDGFMYSGSICGSIDDSRAYFTLYTQDYWVLCAGFWQCGGRKGEWYINGRKW